MISDETVSKLFQRVLDTPDGFMNPKWAGETLQIFRGLSPTAWKDIPPGGCIRLMSIFNKSGVIPKYCFSSYKIEIYPRTVVELFKLLMVFEEISLPHDNTRKCMAEGRHYCSGAYKGIVYCRDINEAKELQEILRSSVSDAISQQVPVTLKRGCSEYALVYPEFARVESGVPMMEYKQDWQPKEEQYWQSVDAKEDQGWQSISNKLAAQNSIRNVHGKGSYHPYDIYSMQAWLRYAATIGDMSYLKISGIPLAPIPELKRPPFSPPPPETGEER